MSSLGVTSLSSNSGIITPQTISTSGGLTSGSTLTNNGAGGQLQLTGLGTGINTNQLIQAELAVKEMPLTNLQASITAMNTENQQLAAMQTSLQTTSFDSLDLSLPSLFFQKQTVTSSNPTLVTATAAANLGAVIGSTTVAVARLASASSATFGYTADPNNADTLTIGNDQGTQSVAITAGETNTQIANDINGNRSGIAYATVLSNGQLVISSRTTGDGTSTGTGGGNPITLSSALQGSLTAVSSQAGQDAQVYINGSTTASYSQTDTITDAVPGVTLTLNGVTPTNAPITITTSPPAPDTTSITAAVQNFVNDYNSAMTAMQAAINTAPPSETNTSLASGYTGSLFGDPQIENALSHIRQSMYATDTTLTTGFQSMQDLGITTGASTGTATAGSTDGLLTLNTATLAAAIQANPQAVQAALNSWAQQYQKGIANISGPSGLIQARITGNNTEISNLSNQLQTQTEMFQNEEKALQAQWAQVEGTLGTLNSQKTSLTSFSNRLSNTSSSGN
jgi:flagellar hook-associated protein 2